MRGHHIYTSSWFKYGSNSKNPGTYTVELTNDIFGSDTEDVIFKLNQMCASVPETLTPRNTNESFLRLYHILPDTTVVSRSWFVSDEITGRGTVPYTHSLIFRGGDNERFLHCPSKSFDISSAEPYKSYLGRVSAEAPTEHSTRYDPRGEDYKEPFVYSQNEWIANLGIDEELFIKYYVSLGRAICSRSSTRLAVILPKNRDSEKLILATLSLLPLFMKRKFAAASKWTGLMDGSGSTAVSGIQLLCYYDESPVSESGFSVIDLTGSGRHANIAGPTLTEYNYTKWIWKNIDESKKLIEYENFIEQTFTTVLDKIPFEVVANSFFLWLNGNIDTYEIAKISLLLIAGSFAKNFAKFEFIKSALDRTIKKLLERIIVSDYDIRRVQAVCLLATNGSVSAKKLVDKLFDEFKDKECWDKLAIILQYFKTVWETNAERDTAESTFAEEGTVTEGSAVGGINVDRNNAIKNLWSCIYLSDKSKECAKIAMEPLIIHCQKMRDTILTDKQKSDEVFTNYMKLSESLNKILKLPNTFFQLKDILKINSIDAERFFQLDAFDVGTLGYTPSALHWVQAINWAANLTVVRRCELWLLYYLKIKGNIGEYIIALEKAGKAEHDRNRILSEFIESSSDAAKETAQFYMNDFTSRWNAGAHPLDSDATWNIVKEFLDRIERVPLDDQGVLEYIREMIGLKKDNIEWMAEQLSKDSFQTIDRLYKGIGSPADIRDIIDLDSLSIGSRFSNDLATKIRTGAKSQICINRMLYWYKNTSGALDEWAFAIATAKSNSVDSIVKVYFELRHSKMGVVSGKEEASEVFKIVDFLTAYGNLSINRSFDIPYSIKERLVSIDKESFKGHNIRKEFKNLYDSVWKSRVGEAIYDILKDDRNVSEDILNDYKCQKITNITMYSENNNFLFDWGILAIIATFLAIIAGFAEFILLILCGGNEIVTLVLGKDLALIVPYSLVVLIIIATLFSVIRISRNGGY